ncbi:MAG: type II toxin-antitoxin system RelE/ParE family toxin [Syntrophales bacterium]|jgi:plasmid stabilization system protein ParE|nr:type II toxin-antitoxin system RelE/ParE family toxin [Syntrophales bacterium]
MTIDLRLRPESEQDLADAAVWYEEQRDGMGNQFLDEVLSVFSVISETPLMFPVVHRNIRRALIHRFPFGVYYRVESDGIVVVAVMHGSRDPRQWKSRT